MKAWAIRSGDVLLVWTIRLTRKEATEALAELWTSKTWKEWEAHGCKAVKVRVIEDGPPAAGK